VLPAASAEEAMERLERDRVDILFSDVVMPGPSGVDLAKRAREQRPGLPVLLASGHSDEILAGAGASFEFLRKPYDASALGTAIQRALDQVEAVGA
jgi:DNA-binding NtrC family response regulator